MARVAQARGTARHEKPATAISQPKGLERNLRNELIASPAIWTSEPRPASPLGRRQGECAMSRRTEWRERYPDQTSLVKSVRVDWGRSYLSGITLSPWHRSVWRDPRRSRAVRSFRRRDLNEHRKHRPNPSRPGSVRIDDCLARGIASASAAFAGSGLPSVRRPARIVRYSE